MDEFFQKNSFQCHTTKSNEEGSPKPASATSDVNEDRLLSDNNILYTLLMKSDEFIKDDYLREMEGFIASLKELSFGLRQ